MAENTVAAGKAPEVSFVPGGVMVNGIKVPLPKRPKDEVIGTAYDVMTLVGVTASAACTIAKLLEATRK